MITVIKYRLCWRTKVTGKFGQGEPIFDDRNVAEEQARRYNRQELITFWVEPAEVDKSKMENKGQ